MPFGSPGSREVFTDKASGAQRERPQLREALEYMRDGDILVVWKLDRLARSLKQLIETGQGTGTAGSRVPLPDRGHRHDFRRRQADLPYLRGSGRVRTLDHPRAHEGRTGVGPGPRAPGRAAAGAVRRGPAAGPGNAPGPRNYRQAGGRAPRGWRLRLCTGICRGERYMNLAAVFGFSRNSANAQPSAAARNQPSSNTQALGHNPRS